MISIRDAVSDTCSLHSICILQAIASHCCGPLLIMLAADMIQSAPHAGADNGGGAPGRGGQAARVHPGEHMLMVSQFAWTPTAGQACCCTC